MSRANYRYPTKGNDQTKFPKIKAHAALFPPNNQKEEDVERHAMRGQKNIWSRAVIEKAISNISRNQSTMRRGHHPCAGHFPS